MHDCPTSPLGRVRLVFSSIFRDCPQACEHGKEIEKTNKIDPTGIKGYTGLHENPSLCSLEEPWRGLCER